MYTSFVLLALSPLAVGRPPASEVAWMADYSSARQVVHSERKPLAV